MKSPEEKKKQLLRFHTPCPAAGGKHLCSQTWRKGQHPSSSQFLTVLLLCRDSLPRGAPAWPDSGRAQFYNLMLSNLSSYVCSSLGRGWNTSRWWIQHSPSQCIEFYGYLLVLHRNKSNFMVCVEVGSYIRSLLLFALDDFMWLNPQIYHSGNAL